MNKQDKEKRPVKKPSRNSASKNPSNPARKQNVRRNKAPSNEERFSAVFRLSPIAIAILRASDGRFVDVNDVFVNISGYSRDEIIGHTALELNLYANPQERAARLKGLMERGSAEPYEFTMRNKSAEIAVGLSATTEIAMDGEKHYLSMILDITERKHAEDALRESEAQVKQLIGVSPVAMIVAWGIEERVLSINDKFIELFGYTLEDIPDVAHWWPLAYPDEKYREEIKAQWDARFQRAIGDKDQIEPMEATVNCRDGSHRYVEFRLSSVGERQVVTFVDLTGRRRADEALRQYAERLERAEMHAGLGSWEFDVMTGKGWWSKEMYRLLYFDESQAVPGNEEYLEHVHPEDRSLIREVLFNMSQGQITSYREFRSNPDFGPVRYFTSSVYIERDSQSNPVKIMGTTQDISKRKHHELEREAIINVSNAMREATTRAGILTTILDQLVDLFDADGALLVLPDSQTGGYINEMGRGAVGERMTGLNIPPGMGICNWVIANKKPYLTNHAESDPLFYRPDLLGDSHCVACVPLITHLDQTMGALWIARAADITDQEVRLLSAIANIAASTIHRVTLHEQTEQQVQRLTALHQIDIAISTNFELNITLNIILNNVKQQLGVDAAGILLLAPVTQTLDYAAGTGFRTRNIERSHVKLGEGYAGRAALEYRVVAFPDLEQANEPCSRPRLVTEEEFKSHFIAPLIVKRQVKGVLEVFHRKPLEPAQEWLSYFETLATQAAIAIENASLFENLNRSNTELILAYDATIEGWSHALDLRDRDTEGHTQRVAEMALKLADKMGMNDTEKSNLRRGALLHDIGKMGIPDSILLKPGPLTEEEWNIMRQHPVYAYEMLAPIAYLRQALVIPYCHHEKWDGSGYPRGLKGDDIPFAARVFAVVDVFDGLSLDRPYRSAWSREAVYEYIREQAGRHFDPGIVKAFLEMQ